MASLDRVRALADIVPGATDGVPATTQGENNRRTEKYQLRVTADVNVTVAGTLRNQGSILALLTEAAFIDGGVPKYVGDPRLLHFIAEAMAPSTLPRTVVDVTSVSNQTNREDTLPLFLASPRTLDPNETKYVEANKQLQQQISVTPLRTAARLGGGAFAAAISNLRVRVEQVCDDILGVPPLLNVYGRQVTQDVTAANTQLKIDLRGSRYIRGIAIQQDTDAGEVTDIINALTLRGDARAIIGDRPVSYRDLQVAAAAEMGGQISNSGYLFIDFLRYGRLASLFSPYQDANLRLELDVQPSVFAGGTNSKVRVFVWEYERTPTTASQIPFQL